ncbi:MAG TPA: cation transporter [Gemmatimonadaceae bacterium]|nr:cation transporter [Gemmatimonadaceae bacterium]
MRDLHIEIVGMTCEHCVRAVQNRLSSTAGVTVSGVKVGSADISLDESKTSLADVEEAISDEGYTVDTVTPR